MGSLLLIVPRFFAARIEVQRGVKEDNNIELLSSRARLLARARAIFHIGYSLRYVAGTLSSLSLSLSPLRVSLPAFP